MNRAGQLAQPVFFPRRFACGNWVFAELQAGVETIHGVALDTASDALYCTCPFFPKPCWHALALSALYAQQGTAAFEPAGELPGWLQQRSSGQPFPLHRSGLASDQRETQRIRRHDERLDRAGHGFDDLETWLLDTLRRGVATAVSEDPAFFKSIASRLADASMRGLSRNFRLLESLPADAPGWPEQTLAVLAEAALALRAFRARQRLPEALLSDLEAFIGIAMKKDTVLEQGERLRDTWAVAGAFEETVEEQLRQRRTWLLGARSGRYALLLDYAFGEAGLVPGFAPGAILDGELAFYPSAWPLRALAPETLAVLPEKAEKLPGFDSVASLAHAFATALGAQPWLAQFPAALNAVLPYAHNGSFGLADTAGQQLPLANGETAGWPLVALAGGRPLTVFGEWNGSVFLALSALAEGRMAVFPDTPPAVP